MEPLRPVSQERINLLKEEWTRLEGLFKQISQPEWKSNLSGKSIVDIACGYNIPIGVLSFAVEQGIDTQYHGYDIYDWKENAVDEIGQGVKDGRFDETLSQKFSRIQPRIAIHYGSDFDATSKEFPDIVSASAGQIGLLLVRQPDVRGNPDTFSAIIGTAIKMSLANDAPLIITTSNDLSRDEIYKFIDNAFVDKGFQSTRNIEIKSDTHRFIAIKKEDVRFGRTTVRYSYLSPPIRDAFLGYWREYVNASGRIISVLPHDTSKFQAKPNFFYSTEGTFVRTEDSITIEIREIKKKDRT